MPRYKKQHYLPASYLKQFSVDGAKASRGSGIYRTDRKCTRLVPVESQCAADYHYSKATAKNTEAFFSQGESLFEQIAQVMWAEKAPTDRDYFGLILMMFDLHIRNIAYENKTGEENYQAYLRRQAYVRGVLLSENSKQPISEQASADHLANVWRVAVLRAPEHTELLTSDNPSIWCNWERGDRVDCIVLPALPHFCAIAYDRRYSRIVGDINEADLMRLNVWQANHCVDCVYSKSNPSEKTAHSIRESLGTKSRSAGYTDANSWNMRRVGLGGEAPFSFIAKV